MWRVWWADSMGCGWQRGPSLHLLRCCLSAKKGSGEWQSGELSHHLWSGAWVWTVWICKWFTWASKCVCVLWSREASSVPEANLTLVKFTTSLHSWDSSLSETITRPRALSSGSGQVWLRCDSVLISVTAGSLRRLHHRGGYFTPTAPGMCDIRVTDSNVTPTDPHMFGMKEGGYDKFTVSKEASFWVTDWFVVLV